MPLKPSDAEFWERLGDQCSQWGIVPGEGKDIVQFNARSVQKHLLATTMFCMGHSKDLLHVKARRYGATSVVTWFLHLLVSHRPNMQVGVIANKDDTTSDIARRMIEFHRDSPDHIRVRMAPRDTKVTTILRVLHPSRNRRGDYEPSFTHLMSVKEEDPGRGHTFQAVLADELGKWDQKYATKAWPSVRNARSKKGGILIAMGTPSHYGDPLHTEYHSKSDRWVRTFYPWFLVEEYRSQPPPFWRPQADVVEYATRHGLDTEQAYYLEKEILPDCGMKWDDVEKEYPSSVARCWQRAGSSSFNQEALDERRQFLESRGVTITPTTLHSVDMYQFEDPDPDACYLITVDPAGSEGEIDYFAIQVTDISRCVQVAEVWCHAHAATIAQVCLSLSDMYNLAMIAIEANGVGNGLISHFPHHERSRLFHRKGHSPLQVSEDAPLQPGWWSNDVSKFMAFDALVSLSDTKQIAINSLPLLEEMQSYRGDRRRARDPMGGHFDRMSAMCIAAWFVKHARNVVLARHARLRSLGLVGTAIIKPGTLAVANGQVIIHPPQSIIAGHKTPYGLHR